MIEIRKICQRNKKTETRQKKKTIIWSWVDFAAIPKLTWTLWRLEKFIPDFWLVPSVRKMRTQQVTINPRKVTARLSRRLLDNFCLWYVANIQFDCIGIMSRIADANFWTVLGSLSGSVPLVLQQSNFYSKIHGSPLIMMGSINIANNGNNRLADKTTISSISSTN